MRHPNQARMDMIPGRFQSTHPRGMRQIVDDIRLFVIKISIHASAWDATLAVPHLFDAPDPISIHASAWDATPSARPGSRRYDISIHASAWDAT